MKSNRFKTLTSGERALLFEALLFCIESNSGIGFRSEDQTHPDYHDGANGSKPPSNADCSDKNILFQMVRELSLHLADDTPVKIHRRFGITTWEHFCKRAIEACENNPHKNYVPLYARSRKKSPL
jgi:hypothetical protein